MIPRYLRISGFTSYSERQPAEIDFSELDLACISGPNGAGKSSLLDAITFALYAKARKTDEAIINTASKRAEVCLDFEYEGQTYRVQRSLTRGKGSSLEFYIQNPEAVDDPARAWRSLTRHSVKETDREIENTLRLDYESFVNASFFLQGKADSFATQRPAERKRILSSILGLDQWEKYKKAATDRISDCTSQLKLNEDRMGDVQRYLDQEDSRRKEQQELVGQRALAAEKLRAELASLETQRANQERLRAQRENHQLLQRQADSAKAAYTSLEDKLTAKQNQWKDLQADLAQAEVIEAAFKDYQELREHLSQVDQLAEQAKPLETELQKIQGDLAAKLAELRTEAHLLEEEQKRILDAQGKGSTLDRDIVEIGTKIEELQGRLLRKDALDKEIEAAEAKVNEWKSTEEVIKQRGKDLKARVEKLAAVEGAKCPLCGGPLAEHDRERLMAEIKQELEEKRRDYADAQAAQKEAWESKKALQNERNALTANESQLHAFQLKAEGLVGHANRLAEEKAAWEEERLPRLMVLQDLLNNEAFMPELRERAVELEGLLKDLGYDPDEHAALRRAEADGRQSQDALRHLEVAKTQVAGLQASIQEDEAALKLQDAQRRALQDEADAAAAKLASETAGMPDPRVIEENVAVLQEDLAEVDRRLGAADQWVHDLGTQQERKKALLQEAHDLRTQIADLKSLEKAFGKDGVPALLIEQELPELERQANEILQRLSNYGMNVQISTQREYKDKKRQDRIETLDILISDGSSIRDYETYSGGEAFRVNFAIRLALSKVLAQRAGARLQTLVIDEGFGNQDAEGRQRLIEAINIVKDDFALVLIITHIEELKEQFPARIEVSKNSVGSVVELIPG